MSHRYRPGFVVISFFVSISSVSISGHHGPEGCLSDRLRWLRWSKLDYSSTINVITTVNQTYCKHNLPLNQLNLPRYYCNIIGSIHCFLNPYVPMMVSLLYNVRRQSLSGLLSWYVYDVVKSLQLHQIDTPCYLDSLTPRRFQFNFK